MRDHIAAPAVSCILTLAIACAPAPEQEQPAVEEAVSTEADVAAIHALMDRWAEGLNNEDTDAMLALFTPGTVFMPPDEPAITGTEAVRSRFDAQFAEEGTVEYSIQTDEVKVAGDWAAGRGTYTFSSASEEGEPVTNSGKWIILYERGADGSWRSASLVYNFDAPQPSEGS